MSLDARHGKSGRRWALPAGCEFPQLGAILDPDRLTDRLRAAWNLDGAAEIVAADVERFHYKRGASCRLVFRVAMRPLDSIAGEEQWLFGRMAVPGHERNSEPTSLVAPRFGPARFRIEEWNLDLWTFPNDPDLPGAALLFDPARLAARLHDAPSRGGDPTAARTITSQLVKHVPGKRCTARVRVAHGGATVATRFAKAYRPDAGAAAYDTMLQIWDSAPRREGAFLLPEPYAYDHEFGVLWLEDLDGPTLNKDQDLLRRLPELAAAIGARLAGLHRVDAALPRALDFAAQIDWLDRAERTLGSAYAEIADRCRPALAALRAAAPVDEPEARVVLHASFKPSHIMMTARGIAFFDFDGACLGDPTYDVGRWIAHVRGLAGKGNLDPTQAERAIAEFLAGYRGAAPHAVSDRRVAWYAACNLLAGAMDKGVKRMDPRTLATVARLAEAGTRS